MNIFKACRNGDIDFVRKYVNDGGDVNVKASGVFTPPHQASYYGHVEVCRLLLQNGSNVNSKTSLGTPLHYASHMNHFEVCQLLLQNGADPTIPNSRGNTPITLAEDIYIVSLLSSSISGSNTKSCRK